VTSHLTKLLHSWPLNPSSSAIPLTLHCDENESEMRHLRLARFSTSDCYAAAGTGLALPLRAIADVEDYVQRLRNLKCVAFPLRWPHIVNNGMRGGPLSVPDEGYTQSLLGLPKQLEIVVLIFGIVRKDAPTRLDLWSWMKTLREKDPRYLMAWLEHVAARYQTPRLLSANFRGLAF
jgi:hypothetical protein